MNPSCTVFLSQHVKLNSSTFRKIKHLMKPFHFIASDGTAMLLTWTESHRAQLLSERQLNHKLTPKNHHNLAILKNRIFRSLNVIKLNNYNAFKINYCHHFQALRLPCAYVSYYIFCFFVFPKTICSFHSYLDGISTFLLCLCVCLSPPVFIWLLIGRLMSVVTVFII